MTFSFRLFLVCILVLLIPEPRIYSLFYSCNSLLNLLREEYKTISIIVCFFIFFGPSLLCIISLKVYNIMGRKRIDRFSVLFGKIVSREFSDFFQRQKLEDHEALLKKLKKNMIVIDAVLPVDNFEPVITESGDQIWWLNVLNGIILGLEDLLHDVSELEAKLKITANPTTPNNGLSECIEEKMKEIIKEMDYFARITGKQVSWTREPHQLSATDSFEDLIEVLGREEDKKAVLNLLLSHNNDDQIGIITIVGESGVGKSTLAQLVYNDNRVEEHFDSKEWIYVSENCDFSRWYQIFESRFEWGLFKKKFLVILDDVWCGQEFIVRSLQKPVPWPNGSKIIVTTRFQAVAAELWSLPLYHLKPITLEDSWRLFAEHAFASENSNSSWYGRLEAIGKTIVRNKCDGLPLAAKVLGGVLRFKPTVEDWDAILTKTNISDDLMDTTTGLPPALVWSYYYLPEHLKQLFAFCAIFPKSYEYEENQIIRYWKAQDLLQQPDDNKTMEQIGHENFLGLVSRSFFQRSRGNRSSSFVMHDRLHELAQLVSQDVRCDQANQDKGGTHSNKMPAETSVGYSTCLRQRYKLHPISLCLTVAAYFTRGLSLCFGSYPSSAIAATQDNLKSRKDDDVPKEVDGKTIVDYFFPGDISRKLDEDEDENKKDLEELSCTDVSITSLGSPPETSKISNEDSSIKHEGASEIPLKMTESPSDTDDPINIWYSQISSLESLKVSEISQPLKLPPRLHTLKMEGCDALKSLPEELMLNNIHLQQLYIIDCCFLESFSVDHLPTTLKSLYIRNCRKLKFPSPSETKQHALLEHLCIGSSCDSLSSFYLTLFPKLRSLAIWDCVNFSSISISENHKSLDALEIRDCPELLSFLEEGLQTPNLTSLFLSNCKNLKGIPKPMDKLISLRSFFINGCPELSSIIHGCFPENLSSLCITSCHKLTPSIQWKMNELNKLSCFEIEGGCIDLKSFPEQNLLPSSLNSLRISRLSNLEFLDYKGLECLTSLETLKINGCDKLQSFPEEGLPSSVTYLYINECSLLKARFQNKRGKEWYKIAHVTHIEIDEEVMS